MTADDVAARALRHVGTPFRLFGRDPDFALDCVGLVALCINAKGDWQYGLKGDYLVTVDPVLQAQKFRARSTDEAPRNGDVALVQCAPHQQHLMVRANNGWVHAHAGLGRVVHMPGMSPWPLITLWRLAGE